MDQGCGGTNVTCTTAAGVENGVCETTTGNGAYCAFGFACFACRRDPECQEVCGLASAACVRCEAACPDTGGTGCANPTTNCP